MQPCELNVYLSTLMSYMLLVELYSYYVLILVVAPPHIIFACLLMYYLVQVFYLCDLYSVAGALALTLMCAFCIRKANRINAHI